jgi:cobalt-zinc-cadmium resistance protein CzcA
MLMFTIEGGGLTLAERRTLLDWTLLGAAHDPGVADVNALGGEVQSFAVIPDRAKLSAAGLTFRQSPMRSSATTATTVGPDDRRRGG